MNIILLINSFRNINMMYKGHYYIEFKFYTQTKKVKYFANPTGCK